ncbi:MAG: endonuclease/exonuclease/phosphatase family protein [Parasphingorhabdus sp.]
MQKLGLYICTGAVAFLLAFSAPASAQHTESDDWPRASSAELSVLTYNVRGLPWPIAKNRSRALRKIAATLRQMRENDEHPQIVLLQEAFTGSARAIGRLAGYKYVISGPSSKEKNNAIASPADREFLTSAQWDKGEGLGKIFGSGLQILSDYPVTEIHKLAFPKYACAGFDCLANKGVVLVTVDIPRLGSTVQIANAHLNAKRSSRVSEERRKFAVQRQIEAAHAFIGQHLGLGSPLIFGGDFNVGNVAWRRELLFGMDWPIKLNADALRRLAANTELEADAQEALDRATDWQFFHSGKSLQIIPQRVSIPFGRDVDGNMLSDHVGYTIIYKLTNIGTESPEVAVPTRESGLTRPASTRFAGTR